MWETREVTLTLCLPPDVADQAEEVQKTDHEFLGRIVLQALIRRGIYTTIRERWLGNGMEPIGLEEGRRILAENRHHDGGAWSEKAGDA